MKSKFWLAGPEAHDFPAAADYLDLLFPEQATTVFAPSTTCLKTLKYLAAS